MIDTFFMKRYKYDSAAVAQTVEQRTENPCVNSSILFGGTKEIALSGVISFFISPLDNAAFTSNLATDASPKRRRYLHKRGLPGHKKAGRSARLRYTR